MPSKNPSKTKKGLKKFLLSEEGRVNKKNILKAGIALALLGYAAKELLAQHTNFFSNPSAGGKHSSHASHASHGSHTSHSSHASHGSHASHSSCW